VLKGLTSQETFIMCFAHRAQPAHTLPYLELLSAHLVLLDHHQQLAHRHALSQAVRKDRTTLQPKVSAHHAWPEHILIRLALLCAKYVPMDHHHQLVHHHAHHAWPGHTLVQLDRLYARSVLLDHHHQLVHRHAHHAWPGHTLVQLDRRSARNVREDHHHQLVHRRAHPVQRGRTLLKRGRNANLVVPGHTRALQDQ
jgi:hypothetical protein